MKRATFNKLMAGAVIGGSVLNTIAKADETYDVTVEPGKCEGCGECERKCPVEVFEMQNDKAVVVNAEECIGCLVCIEVCEPGAISVQEV